MAPNGRLTADERLATLEGAVSSISSSVAQISAKVDSLSRTPWQNILGGAGIILTFGGMLLIVYNRDMVRAKEDSDGLLDRIEVSEQLLRQGYNERWSKADHNEYANDVEERFRRLESKGGL